MGTVIIIRCDRMGLFSRKKEEKSLLPDLPESSADLPRLPEYGAAANLNSDVPMSSGNGMMDSGQSAIKNEIHSNAGEMQKSQFEPLPHYDGQGMPAKIVAEPAIVEESHGVADDLVGKGSRDPSGYMHEPRTFEMHETTKVPSSTRSARPIYIRLDKFKAGLESFDDIKTKLTEIEDLLVKIREMKDKEERELEEWEREIQVVKARIEQIDNDVFKNVE